MGTRLREGEMSDKVQAGQGRTREGLRDRIAKHLEKGPATLREISQSLFIDPHSASTVLVRMERMGLLAVVPGWSNKRDRRYRLVNATPPYKGEIVGRRYKLALALERRS